MKYPVAIAILMLGCSKKEEAPPSPTSPAATVPSQPVSATPRGRADSVGEKLQQEGGARKPGDPSGETVLSALEKAGMRLKDRKQHAASPVGAVYCIGAQSENSVSLSVCEYASEAAARTGRETSIKAFQSIANREVLVNRGTTLTLLQAPRSAASEAEVKKATEAFSKL